MSIKIEEIVYVLLNHEKLIQNNLKKKKELYEEMRWQNEDRELIEALALRSGLLSSSGGKTAKGLEELVIKKSREQSNYQKELQKRMEFLDREWKIIQRVWVCLQALSTEQNVILRKMYLEKEKWSVIERQLSISHGSLVKKRKKALLNIQKMYDSPYTNLQIAGDAGSLIAIDEKGGLENDKKI